MASKWYGKERLKEIETLLTHKMNIASEFVKDEAKRLCPVDTGNLKSSLAKEVKSENGEVIGRIGTNVDYAIYVEYGADKGKKPRKVGAMPFLRPALLQNKQQITKLFT